MSDSNHKFPYTTFCFSNIFSTSISCWVFYISGCKINWCFSYCRFCTFCYVNRIWTTSAINITNIKVIITLINNSFLYIQNYTITRFSRTILYTCNLIILCKYKTFGSCNSVSPPSIIGFVCLYSNTLKAINSRWVSIYNVISDINYFWMSIRLWNVTTCSRTIRSTGRWIAWWWIRTIIRIITRCWIYFINTNSSRIDIMNCISWR